MKAYASYGLMTWFNQIIPTLFPFMVLQNLLLLTGTYKLITKPLLPITRKLYRVRDILSFPIIVGFLFGFPLGAKTVCDLYQKEQISYMEAEYLLAFVNNLSPAYLLGFLYPFLKAKLSLPLYCFYLCGLPLLYGLLLRCTFYHMLPDNSIQERERFTPTKIDFFYALEKALSNSISGITMMGGYMVLFQLPIFFIAKLLPALPTSIIHMNIEISGGLKQFFTNNGPNSTSLFSILLPIVSVTFNGTCCLFQTTHYLIQAKLSMKKYMLHKILLCSILCIIILCTYP